MAHLNDFRTKHLFLLIGGNPLPNYVAAKLLTHPDSHLYFVYSKETKGFAENLMRSLQWPSKNIHHIQVDDAEAQNIFSKIQQQAREKTDVGLHYTGGTKAMAVHAYRGIESATPQATFSYLNARNLKMLIDRPGTISKNYKVGLEVELTIEALLDLHNYTLEETPTSEPFQVEFCRSMLDVSHKEWRKWCDENLKDKNGVKKEKVLKRNPVTLPQDNDAFSLLHPFWTDCDTLNDLADIWEQPIRDVARFLDGLWLENYTLWATQQVQVDCNIHQSALNIKPKETKFEFDVVAMRGYQLFALSCTTDSTKSLIKSKLFEAYIRARQMGGDEARVAVVCYSPQDNPDNNPALIQSEVEKEWEEARAKVRVFGKQHLHDLPNHLRDWFKQASN